MTKLRGTEKPFEESIEIFFARKPASFSESSLRTLVSEKMVPIQKGTLGGYLSLMLRFKTFLKTTRLQTGMEKETYDIIAKQHDLPSFEDMEREFEISLCEEGVFPLKDLIKTVQDMIDSQIKHLEELMQPDANLSTMFELENLSDADKKKTYDLFKRLMFLLREMQELHLRNEEAPQATFLKNVFPEWKSIKQELLTLLEKQKNYWRMLKKVEQGPGYFG